MPAVNAIILSAIVLAFVVFGIVLAWAETQTRHVKVGRAAQGAEDGRRHDHSRTAAAPLKAVRDKVLLDS